MATKPPQQPSLSATTVAPRLVRAVAEATQPYGPFLRGEALLTLEEYMSDVSKTQSVYQALLNRASAEPISLAVVAKCVDVLKRYITKFAASTDVLQQIDTFCQATAVNLGSSYSGLQKSVLYLHTLAANLLESRNAGRTATRRKHARGISEPALLVKRGSSSSLGKDEFHRTNSVPEGTEAAVPLPNGSQGQSSSSLPFSAPTNLAQSLKEEDEPSSSLDMKCDVLHWRWAPSTPEESAAAMNAGIFPHHHTDLSHFSLSGPPDPGEALVPSAAHAHAVQQEINIIRQVQRVQVQHASHPGPESLRPKLRDNRPRLLFQHLPYSQQEKLQLSEREVAAVVEGVFGITDGQSFWGGKDLLAVREPAGRSKQLEHAGRVCATVLLKLLLDLWTHNDASLSFPLALMLLNGGLESESPTVRARAFDVIFNLAVHAELLYPPKTSTFELQMQASEPDEEKRKEDTAKAEEAPSSQQKGGQEASADAVADANKQRFQQWLLMLLFQLLATITEREEKSEIVWSSAFGVLLHMTIEDGKPDRTALQSLPPQVLSAFLRCCSEFHWSEQAWCHLVRMTANLLYTPIANPEGGPAWLHKSEITFIERQGEVLQTEKGAILQTAADFKVQSEADSEPTLVLKDEKLEAFGGISEVVRHFKTAPSPEAMRNLLCVLVDYASAEHIKAGVNLGQTAAQSGLLEKLRLLGYALEAGSMAELLQGAFQCAWPGFANDFARTISLTTDAQAGQDGQNESQRGVGFAALVSAVLGRLEALACDSAVTVPPQSLLPDVQETLDCVQGGAASGALPDPEAVSSGAWRTLAEHLCSEDEWTAALGSSWLLSLLLASAERHLAAGVHRSGSFKRGAVALFPQLYSHLPSPKGPKGIQDQPRLAALLQHVLTEAPPQRRAARAFVQVVRRLLQYIKFKCGSQGGSLPTSPQPAGPAYNVPIFGAKIAGALAIMSPSSSLELGLNSSPTAPPYLFSDEEATPRPEGNGSANELHGKGDFEWEEATEVWARSNAVDLMLPTLFLAVEWLLDLPPGQRCDACLNAAELLLEIVVTRSSYESPFTSEELRESPRRRGSDGDWVVEEFSAAAAPSEAATDGLANATRTCSIVTAFLLGAVAVPRDVLFKVSPVLLIRLFQHLGTGMLPSQPNSQGLQAAIWGRDVRAAVLLLLIARCSLDTAALQQAGGEGVFVDLLSDSDPRVRFHASTFLQQRLRTARPEVYRRALRHLMQQAQQQNDNKLLRNAHLQLSAMLEMRLVDFSV